MVKAFISYSWDNDEHKNWVCGLATRLRKDGIDVTLDQWHLIPGDQLPEFMERAVRESDYVLIICTHKYKERSDNRRGGVGYEGDIMTAEVLNNHNHRKFIPVLREETWEESSPTWLKGKFSTNLSSSPYSQEQYDELISTLLGTRKQAPPVSPPQLSETKSGVPSSDPVVNFSVSFEPIEIKGIIGNEVGYPRNDGTRGSALYKIPILLSGIPPNEWAELFIKNWNHPPRYTLMHRSGIASIVGDTVVLDGTTIEEVKDYHRDTLILVIKETNKSYKSLLERKQKTLQLENEAIKKHRQKIDEISDQIKFDDD